MGRQRGRLLAMVVSVVVPSAVCRIGTFCWPGKPVLPKLVTLVFLAISPPRAIRRLALSISIASARSWGLNFLAPKRWMNTNLPRSRMKPKSSGGSACMCATR